MPKAYALVNHITVFYSAVIVSTDIGSAYHTTYLERLHWSGLMTIFGVDTMPSTEFEVPEGLTKLLQEFTVAVLRNQPSNLHTFARDYFDRLCNNSGYDQDFQNNNGYSDEDSGNKIGVLVMLKWVQSSVAAVYYSRSCFSYFVWTTLSLRACNFELIKLIVVYSDSFMTAILHYVCHGT